ncbi:MAG: branched-chain amino acid ABC transporter permease [Gammaproteobacteria bacterium]|nr:branched-chain amino acid ABC transporter permease [Gammaproteobacteria bacterium]
MPGSCVSRVSLVAACCALLLALLPWLADAFGDPYLVTLFSRILIYALAAVSLDLIIGYGGMVSLGHAAFVGSGAYVVAILAFHLQEGAPLFGGFLDIQANDQALLVWPLAVVISALLAALIGAISLRTRGMQFIMITLAFAQMLYYLFVSLEGYGGDDGISLWSRSRLPGLDLADNVNFYYVCLASLLLFLWLMRRLVYSRFGRVVRGTRENQPRMESLGFPVYRYQLAAFTIAGAGAGLAGVLLANQNEFVSPGLLHWTHSGELIVMVLLGGMGTLLGPVFGAAALLLMEELLSAYTEHWMFFLGPFLILVVLFAKRGIYGWICGGGDGHG